MNSDEPAPLPSAEIRSSYNGINDDFHIDFFPSIEDSEEFMSLDSIHEEITTPLQSIYVPSGLHACPFCTRNFNYIDVHMPACQKVKYRTNEKMNDRLGKLVNDFLRTKEKVLALRFYLEQKKTSFQNSDKKDYTQLIKKIGQI